MSRTIVIDAGHGGTSPAGNSSAFGVRGPRGAVEKDVMLALAQRVAAHYGSDSILTRQADINLPLGERTAVAQRYGSAVFISLHANSGPRGARGAEAYVHERGNVRSAVLADSIQRELGAYGHAVAPVGREQLAILSPEKLPTHTAACLLEVDYLSDPYGEQRLTDPASVDRMGAAIARGIRRYMGNAALAEGQDGGASAIIIGIVGIGIGLFSLVNALEARNVGGMTWKSNVTKVTHSYGAGQTPHAWRDCNETLLNIDCTGGVFSSAYAVFNVHWRANGNDIDQCRVEKLNSNDWDSSLLTVEFNGVDAASYEENSVGCIMMHIGGTLDPAGGGDNDFNCRVLVKADGTMVNQGDMRVSRGDPSDFELRRLDIGHGFLMRQR
jgi:N-acetylmuramoyl-L-alanine amidase